MAAPAQLLTRQSSPLLWNSLLLEGGLGLPALLIWTYASVFLSDGCLGQTVGNETLFCHSGTYQWVVFLTVPAAWLLGLAIGMVGVISDRRRPGRGWPWALAAWLTLVTSPFLCVVLTLL